MSDRFPRVRRIALAIKSEDFSRRIAPPAPADSLIGGDARTLGGMVPTADDLPVVGANEAGSTEVPVR